VPETIKIVIKGKLQRGVYSKDVALDIVRRFTAKGATYKAVEYSGAVIRALSVEARATLTNMSIEFGAKTSFVVPDKKTMDYFGRRGIKKIKPAVNKAANKVAEMTEGKETAK